MSGDRPHITVATLVEQDGRLLMVREMSEGALVYNQPAGHVEAGETLIEAAVRETREETAWQVAITALLGIYEYTSPVNGITYIRLCFIARPEMEIPELELDAEIAEALWLTPAQISSRSAELRSPLVMAAIEDYLAGKRFPLSLISQY